MAATWPDSPDPVQQLLFFLDSVRYINKDRSLAKIRRKDFTRIPRPVYAVYGRPDWSNPHSKRKEAHVV